MAELLALGKSKPGGLLLGSPGAGSPGHLLAAMISIGTKTPMQYVHYRGGAPVMAACMSASTAFGSRLKTFGLKLNEGCRVFHPTGANPVPR